MRRSTVLHRSSWLAVLVVAATCWSSAGARADDDEDAQRSAAHADGAAPTRRGFALAVRVENGNHRSFRQLEPTTGELRTYDARVYGGIGVTAGYDGSFSGDLVSWSVSADYWRSLFFSSGARRIRRVIDTTAERMSGLVGLALHPEPGDASGSFGVVAGVAAMRFDFDMPEPRSADDERMQLATGNYTLWSTGVEARVPLGAAGLSLRVSHLLGLHTGDFGGRDPSGQAQGFDVLAVVDYGLLPWLDLVVRADATLLWLALSPVPERPADLPASAQDFYLTLGLGGRARF